MNKQDINYLKNMTILFVDDEDEVRESFDTLLNMWSKKAYSASNGKEGLELYDKYKPDIVVTDIRMPVMSGLEMIENLKKIDPDLPVVITTAHQEPELLLEAVELQVDGYIVKPIPKKELKKRLQMMAKLILFEREKDKQLDTLKWIVDASIEAIFLYKDETCINANKAALKLLGFDSKDTLLEQHNLDKFILSMGIDKLICDNKEHYETTINNLKNIEVPVMIKCSDFEIDLQIIKIIAVVDLTHIKELEDEAKKKDIMLFHKSKMTAMGEMIHNIAHQWRQPLSVISTSASTIELQKEFNTLDNETFDQLLATIIKTTQNLSKTLNSFIDFYIEDKQLEYLHSKKLMEKALFLLSNRFISEKIKIIEDIDNIEFSGYGNEVIQALVNIFKNCIDAFEKNHMDEKLIFISLKQVENNMIKVDIKDNAGGINEDIINRIFEPYFTTKHQFQGTGIGLFMTKEIINHHLKGTIEVSNESFEYEGTNYNGAQFEIIFPVN